MAALLIQRLTFALGAEHHCQSQSEKRTDCQLMKEYLFVYGTLLPEIATNEMASVIKSLALIGPGAVQGKLYDLGEYPGAVLDSSESKVFGKVFELSGDESLLKTLDRYEGFDDEDLDHNLFVRAKTNATLNEGLSIECWIYVYNQDTINAALIESGDYIEYKAEARP
jgi:gamma-glutamylcyclotransferase (GGCT)/AIG2-like uncharacterized protein YtfP